MQNHFLKTADKPEPDVYRSFSKPFMKILAVSDEPIERLYDTKVRDIYPDISLLFGCGDLPYYFLEFLVSVFNQPLFYVPGNHDPRHNQNPGSFAEGCTDLDEKVVLAKGLLIAGLGGSILYGLGGPNQYTQEVMRVRAYRLLTKTFLFTLKHQRPLDILLTHSPPFGIHDDDDPAHQGLRALNLILQIAKPRYLLHGHTFFYKHNLSSHITNYYQTQVVNINPFRLINIDT